MDLETLRTLLNDPRGHELEIGFVLLEMRQAGEFPGGHPSLHRFIVEELHADYSTLMRWLRAARFLGDSGDARAELGVSRILELAKLEDVRDQLSSEDMVAPDELSVRQIREVVRKHRPRPKDLVDIDEPHVILGRAIEWAMRNADPPIPASRCHLSAYDPMRWGEKARLTAHLGVEGPLRQVLAALEVAGVVAEGIEKAQAAWVKRREQPSEPLPPPMPMKDIAALAPSQLEATWRDPDVAVISRGGEPILHLRVNRVPRVRGGIVTAPRNAMTRDAFSAFESVSHGCLMSATGFEGCDSPCFVIEGERNTGCVVNHSRWAARKTNRDRGYDVTRNGLVNDCLQLKLPHDGKPSLAAFDHLLWRVDSESGEGSLSIALGIFQNLAQANPDKRFCALCAHTFRPSDAMLAWTAALRNVWVGHTVSAGLSEEALEVRFRSIRRYIEYRIPSVVWIVTSSRWDNERILRRATDAVNPSHILQLPLRHGSAGQELPVLKFWPEDRICSSRRISLNGGCYSFSGDSRNNRLCMNGRPVRHPQGPIPGLQSMCVGCEALCGYTRLRLPSDFPTTHR